MSELIFETEFQPLIYCAVKKLFVSIAARTSNNESKFAISGRTDLRKGVSEAKFDAGVDFDIKKCLAPPKSAENRENPKKNREKFSEKNFSASKN